MGELTKKELDKQIGQRIRIKREEVGLTREKFAEYIDISPQFIAQIESGNRGMSSETLVKICNTLGASADYIVMGKETNDNNRLYELVDSINPMYKEFAENILHTFIIALSKK